MGDIGIVHLFDVGGYIPITHPKPIKSDDLIRELIRKNRLALLHKDRLKATLPILGGVDIKTAKTALKRLFTLTVALIAFGSLLIIQMGIHFRFQGLFDHVL